MMKLLQILFFLLIVRPLIFIVIGLHIKDKDRLPLQGPAILAPNHNSHLDTLALLSLFPLTKLAHIRPVAAADYFLSNPILAWFSQNIMRIIPLQRHSIKKDRDPLLECSDALEQGHVLILFPEGSRGKPEQMTQFRSGLCRLTQRHPQVPIIPIFIHGLGKSLPKGEFVLVPFFCDILIGQPIYWQGSVKNTMQIYKHEMNSLVDQCERPLWN